MVKTCFRYEYHVKVEEDVQAGTNVTDELVSLPTSSILQMIPISDISFYYLAVVRFCYTK